MNVTINAVNFDMADKLEQFIEKKMNRFERHLNGDDDEEIRLAAFESCPGLSQIWTQPFQMKFEVADGTLVLRFKKTDSGNEVCADLLPGK